MKLLKTFPVVFLSISILFSIFDSANAQDITSEAYQRRQQMLTDRGSARKLADSAFLYVAYTKDYVRDLKNKRNRARNLANLDRTNIDGFKKEFNTLLRNASELQDENEVKIVLARAVDLKKEIYQLETKSRKAELVATKLDRQIKVKTRELEKLNQDASKMQLFSARGDVNSSLEYFAKVSQDYKKSDTLFNYSSELVLIAGNKVKYEIPESELAFAEVILEQRKNPSLLAEKTNVISSPVPVFKIAPEVAFNENLYSNTEIGNENLEIRFDVDIVIPKAVEEVSYNELAYSNTEIGDDILEINPVVDVVTLTAVEEVAYNESAYSNTENGNDIIEINSVVDVVTPTAIEEVAYNESAYSNTEIVDENLEVSSYSNNEEIPEKSISNPLIKLDIGHTSSRTLVVTEVNMEPENADERPNKGKNLASMPQVNGKFKSTFDGVGLLTGKSLYFKSLTIAVKEIETSLTDEKLLKAALENPDILSYEELLYAASIIQSPTDGLSVLEMAFLRTDRDWRAFNNAAVMAMNIHEFEQAKNYLYQAVMLSAHNGKVENNKGILAFYLGDFLEAEACFNMARNYGEQTQQNIQVLRAAKTIYETEDKRQVNHGSQNPQQLMGDIIEYFPAGK
ncbi:MAG: hypothetical protein DRJ05_05390 [Bacteroidetes bacterium]|nr:MAG: hypothetical protein DRJ05_05390 [Bacteroidota bacterium]